MDVNNNSNNNNNNNNNNTNKNINNNNNLNLNNNNNISLKNLNNINKNNTNTNSKTNTNTNNKTNADNNNKQAGILNYLGFGNNKSKNNSNKTNNKNNNKNNTSNNKINNVKSDNKKINNQSKAVNSNFRFDKFIGENAFMLFIIFFVLILITYVVYYYYSPSSSLKTGYTYYGKDLSNYEPLFKLNTDEPDECIKRCDRDKSCSGFTFDKNNMECSGTKVGKLRTDDNNFMAWEKPETKLDDYFEKSLIRGYIDNELVILNQLLPRPALENRFVISFWLNIRDWYNNFEYWKHILHKGTSVDEQILFKDWEDVIVDYPEQYPGFWLAPFTNNLRICITTQVEIYKNKPETEYKHAHTLYCGKNGCIETDKTPVVDTSQIDSKDIQYIKQVEYYDLRDIPINKLFQLSVVMYKKTMEVYFDGKIKQIVKLRGTPQHNSENLYAKFGKSFDGEIYNLNYTPVEGKTKNIKTLFDEKPTLKT